MRAGRVAAVSFPLLFAALTGRSGHGLAANYSTLILAIDLLLEVSCISLSSGDIALLQDLSDEADGCFSVGYTTASTDEERSRSFIETTSCLTEVIHRAGVLKSVSSLFGPVALLVEAAAQLTGYVEALNDTRTGKGTPKTTIRVTPDADDTRPDDPEDTQTTTTGAFTSVTAGHEHSCGLRTNGTITCWGYNHFGQADPP